MGDLTLYATSIGPIPGAVEDGDFDYIAIIGLNVFKQLRIMVRQSTNEIWTQSVSPVPNHNRLRAVFVPGSQKDSLPLAKLLNNGPADRAGLKDGDELVGIGGVPFAGISSKGPNWQAILFSQPAGTTLNLKITRLGEAHEIPVVLENLLNQASRVKSN